MNNILSVDIEEWFHPEAIQHLFESDSWESNETRVEANVNILLNLFNRKNATATFFVLGWVARKHPKMIKKIIEEGHEIASHGNSHKMITQLSPKEFEKDLQESIRILEDVTGQKVLGFRAPTFSIVKETQWAWEIMLKLGLKYDSSVYPIWHDRYGIPDAPRSYYTCLEKDGQQLLEFPMPTLKIFHKNFPFGGGGYLRIFPLWFTRYAIKKFNQEGKPAIIYMHPWEFDPNQPKLELGFLQGKRHYYNISKNKLKLTKLLDIYSWTSFQDYIQNYIE